MRGKKIIIAEASSTIKSVADTLLRQHGYDVVCTSDGLQAWEVIQAERPDLALVGLNLSGITGLELCRQIAGDKAAGGIPSLLMLGAKDKVTADQLLAAGVKGHLKKPFSPKDLLDVVTRLIGPGEGATRSETDKIGRTSYKSEVFSSTGQLESEPEQVQNINWTDIDISGRAKPRKVASLDVDSANDGLIIEEDQFGLTNRDYQKDSFAKEEIRPPDDEDYNWFIGEMKKDVEGGGTETGGQNKETRDRAALPSNEPSDGGVVFDDLTSERNEPVIPGTREPDRRAAASATAAEPKISKTTLNDEEIDQIADKVAAKLAMSIASKIDRKAIIEAIKSSLNG